ncbi:TetR family transcriptional regulator [Leptospira kirschneri serovar Grippotyphosa]|nr:TetR family transcriptional regulator [Leptospira kirschneri serovar Grippotyphosa]
MGSNSLSYPHPKIRVGTQFYRGFVVIPTDLILRSKYLWVRL